MIKKAPTKILIEVAIILQRNGFGRSARFFMRLAVWLANEILWKNIQVDRFEVFPARPDVEVPSVTKISVEERVGGVTKVSVEPGRRPRGDKE